MPRTFVVLVCILAALTGAGCFPVLTHGARVEPGASLGMTSALQAVDRPVPLDSSQPRKMIMGMDLGVYLAGAARPAAWNDGGIRVTGSANLSSGLVLDVYGQMPRALPGSSATGVGVLYQPMLRHLVFPYIMNGWDLGNGSQVYTTLGVANTRGLEDRSERHFLFVAAVGWQAAAVGPALRRLPGLSAYVMFTAGRQGQDCRSSAWCIGGTSRVITALSVALPSFRRRCVQPPSGDPDTGRCAPPGRPRPPRGPPPRGFP